MMGIRTSCGPGQGLRDRRLVSGAERCRSSSASPIRRAARPARRDTIRRTRIATASMYPSYTAAIMPRKHRSGRRHKVNFEGAVTWAFEFEDQPYFDGFRDLATNGIDKPVLNVFRMFGMMGGQRVAVQSSGSADLETMLKDGVRDKPDVSALASRQEHSVEVMVWNPGIRVGSRTEFGAPRSLLQSRNRFAPARGVSSAWDVRQTRLEPASKPECGKLQSCFRSGDRAGSRKILERLSQDFPHLAACLEPAWLRTGSGT